MSQKVGVNNNRVYRLVLTGGPSGGKTMGQARLCTFFESIGWKVYRVPDTLGIFKGNVGLSQMDDDTKVKFYENALKTMMTIENTFFNMAANRTDNCMIICDSGSMDLAANLSEAQWRTIQKRTGWNNVDLRDNRYNQVLHMVSAARGAEEYFPGKSADPDVITRAAKLDDLYSQAWVGHPYFDVIDNSTNFERKLVRMVACVCNHLGIEPGDRLSLDSKKRKFLIGSLPDKSVCPQFQDFIVAHDYLATPNHKMQARVRRRGQNGNWTYTHTIRRPDINPDHSPELKIEISLREYELLLAQKHIEHCTIYKKRRCFLWNNQYFQMDIYQEPCPQRCKGLIMLETYTSVKGDDFRLPDFLDVVKEVTDDPAYSMYNLSKIDSSPMDSKIYEKDIMRHSAYLRDLKPKERYLDKIKAQAGEKNGFDFGRGNGESDRGLFMKEFTENKGLFDETGDSKLAVVNKLTNIRRTSKILDSLDIALVVNNHSQSRRNSKISQSDTQCSGLSRLDDSLSIVLPKNGESKSVASICNSTSEMLSNSCSSFVGVNGFVGLKSAHLVPAEGCE